MRILPTLEEFFLAHGVAVMAPRVVLPFHRRIFDALTLWLLGDLPDGKRNMAICMPPRHGKTFIARDLVSWGLACFPDSEWIYTSCSAKLAVTQTMAIKGTVSSEWYRRAFPYVGVLPGEGRQDQFSTPSGGSVYGVGVGGTITGFGAGKKRPEFGGGIVIDDPIQAKDAYSVAVREGCNTWYTQTLYSRRNRDTTPVLLIMQRLHEQDLVGYLMEREPDLWHILQIPVRDESGAMLWPETFGKESAARMEDMDPFAFSAQYMQSPTPAGGAMFKRVYFQRYETAPSDITTTAIFADTAMKAREQNDYSVFLLAGSNKINVYILDLIRGKWEAPELLRQARMFWEKHRPHRISNPVRFAGFFVEDKASGTGLIQTLRQDTAIPVVAMQRDRDKVSRANDVLPYIAAGRVFVPAYAPWAEPLLAELCAFSPAMTHAHDDQVDTLVDAVAELLSPGGGIWAGMDWS